MKQTYTLWKKNPTFNSLFLDFLTFVEIEAKSLFGAPDPPKTVLEALEQRLQKYKQTEVEAKEKGESSKVRRYGRIVKVLWNHILQIQNSKYISLWVQVHAV